MFGFRPSFLPLVAGAARALAALLSCWLLLGAACTPRSEPSALAAADKAAADKAASGVTAAKLATTSPAAEPAKASATTGAKVTTDAPAPVDPPATPRVPATGKASEDFERIREFRKGIPHVFVDLERKVDDIDQDIQRAMALEEAYLKAHSATEEASLVEAWLGRDYLSRFQRILESVKKQVTADTQGLAKAEAQAEIDRATSEEREALLNRIRALVTSSLSQAKKGSEGRYQALMLEADLAEKDFHFARQVEVSKQLLAEYPEAPQQAKFRVDIGKATYFQAKYPEAVDWMQQVLAKHAADEQYVVYLNLLFDAQTGVGDLAGMKRTIERMQSDFPARLKTTKSRNLQNQYQQWLNVSDFWLGFVLYAEGDIDRALETFKRCQAHLEKLQAELVAQGSQLPAVEGVVLRFRVNDLILFLENFQGRTPYVSERCEGKIKAADLSDGIEWLTSVQPKLGELLGKVVPMLFRLPGNKRAGTFLEELNDLGQASETIYPITLGFLPSRLQPAQKEARYQAMRNDIQELGIRMPVGYDVSEYQCVFRSLHATVGTASFFVLDKEGHYAWYLPDPRDVDRRILRLVLARLERS